MTRLRGAPRNLIIVRALGALWLATGAIFLAVGARQLSEPLRSIAWPSTTGLVLDTLVQEHPRTGGRLLGLLGDSVALPLVRYRYDIGGVLYHSTRVSFRKLGLGSRREAHAVVADYPPGREVRVYYDPDHPGSSALEHGISWITMALMIVGAILIGVGGRWMRTRMRRTASAARVASSSAAES